VTQQIRRLAEAYESDGQPTEAKTLIQMLDEAGEAAAFAPSRIVRSRMSLLGEELTPRTVLPVDRETAVRLVDVIFPDQMPASPPIFDADVADGVQSLISEWAHWDSLQALSVRPTHSCLIYGAPGTGKTRLAMWIAGQLNLPVVLARLDGLVSSFLGTTSRNIGALFQFANRYRCVLLLDEFDAIAKLRDDPQEVGEIKRVVNTLLQSLDGRREIGITIGITNHEQLLDAAVWRRFDVQLPVPRPRFLTRLEIASHYLSQMALAPTELKLISWMSEGLTGAEIEALARSIRKSAAIDGNQFEFLAVLRRLATLNGGRIPADRREVLRLENADLAAALHAESTLDLEQKELASLLGRDPGTISRWLKERNLALS
jgi:SpoVK/Ycf46/Vps4 family AAA+-type ATPase